jgi:hypothetical protein
LALVRSAQELSNHHIEKLFMLHGSQDNVVSVARLEARLAARGTVFNPDIHAARLEGK